MYDIIFLLIFFNCSTEASVIAEILYFIKIIGVKSSQVTILEILANNAFNIKIIPTIEHRKKFIQHFNEHNKINSKQLCRRCISLNQLIKSFNFQIKLVL